MRESRPCGSVRGVLSNGRPYRDQPESRMREICQSGSEGGGTETNRFSLPLSRTPWLTLCFHKKHHHPETQEKPQ